MIKYKNRIGETLYKDDGSRMEIISYKNSFDIDVLFDNGFIAKNVSYASFKNKSLRNPYNKVAYGVGFLGEGIYKANSRRYQTWSDMFDRCMSKKYHSEKPSYIDCEIDQEWHNFQNFAKWYDDNYYQVNDEVMNLDKDILIRGNKLYSPQTCIFVPQRINKLFIRHNLITENGLPMGVCVHGKRYKAQCANSGKNIHIGIYDTSQEAHMAYKKYKEKLIKEMANTYHNKIPDKLYEALMNYQV